MPTSDSPYTRASTCHPHSFGVLVILAAIVFGSTGVTLAETPKEFTMSSDGSVQFGSRNIKTRDGYGAAVFVLDNDIQGSMGEIFEFGEGYISPPFFLNPVDKISGNSSGFTADARVGQKTSEKVGTYKFTLTVLKEGLVRAEGLLKMSDPKLVKNRFLTIELPAFLPFRGKLVKGDEVKEFDGSRQIEFSGDVLKGATLTLFPGDPRTEFSIVLESCSKVMVNENRLIFFPAQDGEVSYIVDLKERDRGGDVSEIMPNGINVWGPDLLGTPDYSTSRNLILNPSFEAGFRYWSFRIFSDFAQPLKYNENYVIDDTVGHTGARSMRFRAMKNPLPFSTFALPVTPDIDYTLSFWAKGSEGKTLGLYVDARSGNSSPVKGMPIPPLTITDQWKRYEVSFNVQNPFVSVFFRPAGDPNLDSFIWIDDVQFEKGKMTDFDQAPLMTQLVSSARGNFLEFGQQPDLKFLINTAPKSKGTVALSVQDFFFNTIVKEDFKFETDDSGKAVIPLAGLDHKLTDGKLRGVFEVTASVQMDGQPKPFKDYSRFSVMNFLSNTHRNKAIFDVTYAYSLQAGGPEMERFVERERNIGYGSYSYDFLKFANDLDLALDKERADLMEKYGFEPTGRLITTAIEGNGQISEMGGKMKILNVKDMIDPTPEQLAAVEEISRVKAELRPWSPVWFFTAESDPGMMPMAGHLEAFAKLIVAANKGIKKGNPNAKVLVEGGPWNIDPENGVKLYERYIQETKKVDPNVKFDGAAGHHYINFPEALDGNVQAFLEMLDRNGHPDWPLYLNEGGGFCAMSIPQLGITPFVWNSGNAWYLPAMSYGVGKAERISATFMARAWLVALKYQDRVACMNNFFTPNRYLDVDFTARVYDKIPNTLGRLLGNAYFYQDVKFVPYARAYVFRQDADGAPIAALWGYKETVDRFKEEPTTVKFDFRGQELTFIDLMENNVTFPKNPEGYTLIPMTPFPIFIQGKPGTQDALSQAIAAGVTADGDESDALSVSAYPEGDGTAMIVLKNNLPRSFSGEATVTLNDLSVADDVKLSPITEIARALDIPGTPRNTDKLLDFDFALQIGQSAPKKIEGTYLLLNTSSRAMAIDGKHDDWKDLPGIELGDGITVRTYADAGNLYFAIEAKGIEADESKVFEGVGFYFDPFERVADWTTPKNAKGDLGIYELKKDDDGNLGAFCHIVQGTQAGSSSKVLFYGKMQPRFEVKTGKTSDGVFVECRIPEVLLSPLKIAPGSRLGLNISIPTKTGLKTLAPIPEYKSPGTLGDLSLSMAIFPAQSKDPSSSGKSE